MTCLFDRIMFVCLFIDIGGVTYYYLIGNILTQKERTHGI